MGRIWKPDSKRSHWTETNKIMFNRLGMNLHFWVQKSAVTMQAVCTRGWTCGLAAVCTSRAELASPAEAPCECLRAPAPARQLSLCPWGPSRGVRLTGGGDTAGHKREWGPCAAIIKPGAGRTQLCLHPHSRGHHGTRDQRLGLGARENNSGSAFWPQLTLEWVLHA